MSFGNCWHDQYLCHGEINLAAMRLSGHASLRVFSKNITVFHGKEAGFLYGPGLYSEKTCERMKKSCYSALGDKRKWDKEHCFYGDEENPKALRMSKALAKPVPLSQTAFARFRSSKGSSRDYHWFYPVQQSLGSTPYQPPRESSPAKSHIKTTAAAVPKSPGDDPVVLKIIEDLRPKK